MKPEPRVLGVQRAVRDAGAGGLLKSTMCSGLASPAFDLVNPTSGPVRTEVTEQECARSCSAHSCCTPGACRSRLITAAPGGAGGGGANLTPFGTELLEGTSVSRNRYLKWLPRTWRHSVGERYEGIRDRNQPPRISSLIGGRTVLAGSRWERLRS